MHMKNIRNRFSGPRYFNQISFEIASEAKPSVDHLNMFGPTVWVQIPKVKYKSSKISLSVWLFEVLGTRPVKGLNNRSWHFINVERFKVP